MRSPDTWILSFPLALANTRQQQEALRSKPSACKHKRWRRLQTAEGGGQKVVDTRMWHLQLIAAASGRTRRFPAQDWRAWCRYRPRTVFVFQRATRPRQPAAYVREHSHASKGQRHKLCGYDRLRVVLNWNLVKRPRSDCGCKLFQCQHPIAERRRAPNTHPPSR